MDVYQLEKKVNSKHLKISADYTNGMSVEELAVKYHMATYSINYALRKTNTKRIRDRVLTEKQKQIIELYNNGMTQTAIAKEFGVSKQRINQIIKKKGDKQ